MWFDHKKNSFWSIALVIAFLLPIIGITSQPGTATTGTLYVYTNTYTVSATQIPVFTVGYLVNGVWQSVSLTITDQATGHSQGYVLSTAPIQISNFLPGLPLGNHIIQFSVSGVTKTLTLLIVDPSTFGSDTPVLSNLQVSPSPPLVNSTFIVSVTMHFSSQQLIMSGNELLYVSANDLAGKPISGVYQFGYGAISSPSNFQINVQLPFWHPAGNHTFIIGFTGNIYLAPYNTTFTTILNGDQTSANLFLNSTTIVRSNTVSNPALYVSTTLSGQLFNTYNTLSYDLVLKTSAGNFSLCPTTSIPALSFGNSVTINNQAPLGTATIIIEIRSSSNILLFSNYTYVLVQDQVSLSYTLNETYIHAGDTVNITGYTTMAGRPNIALTCNFTVLAGTTQVATGVSNNGALNFTLKIPSSFTANIYPLTWTLIPLNVNLSLIPSRNIVTNIIVTQPVSFNVINVPTSIYRLSNLVFTVQVISAGALLSGNAGNFTILDLGTLKTLVSYFANESTSVSIPISKDQTLGVYSLQLNYPGSQVYEAATKSIAVTVFSHPYFDQVKSNSSKFVAGQTLAITGYLVQENTAKTAVANEVVQFWLNTGAINYYIGNATTNLDGSFTFYYHIPSSLGIGTYSISLSFGGDLKAYLGQNSDYPVIYFDNNWQLTFNVPTKLYSLHTFSITIEGAIYGNYQLLYEYPGPNGLQNPYKWLANVSLDKNGNGNTTLIAPNQRGPIVFKLIAFDNTSFVINTSIVYVVPATKILSLNPPITTNKQNIFMLLSSEPYIATLNDLRITPVSQIWNSTQNFTYMFQKPGNYTITLSLQSQYINYTSFSYSFIVYENYTITTNIPSTVYEGSTVYFETTLSGSTIGSIQGAIIEIYNNNTKNVLSEGQTSVYGTIHFNMTFFGPANAIVILVPDQKIGSYYLLEHSFSLLTNYKRQLSLNLQNNGYVVNSGSTAFITVKLTYLDNSPANGVPVYVTIAQNDSIEWSSLAISSSLGILNIKIPPINAGNYLIYFKVNSTSYINQTFETTLTINAKTDPLNLQSNLPLVALGLGAVACIAIFAKRR